MIEDRNVDVEKYLTITQVNGVTGYVWLVDGQFRTVTRTLPVDSNMNELSLDVKYRIENRKVRASFGDCVGKFKLLRVVHVICLSFLVVDSLTSSYTSPSSSFLTKHRMSRLRDASRRKYDYN